VEKELFGSGSGAVRHVFPHGVPCLAVAQGAHPASPNLHWHQLRGAAPLGGCHNEGQREEEHPGGAVNPKRHHGVNTDGDDLNPAVHGAGGGTEQHVQHQAAAE
jgi:hypothetical protein